MYNKEKILNEEILNKEFKSSAIKENINILNIAGGKFEPLFFKDLDSHREIEINDSLRVPYNLLNLDRMYLNSSYFDEILNMFTKSNKGRDNVLFFNHEIFDFLTRFQYQFDIITMYRYLEHVKKTDILYFIYLLSTTLKVGGTIDVIVPDYEKLATRIINENPFDENFEENDIITTFELLNEPYDPHASIWTSKRIYKFFELEKRFIITNLYEDYLFDGRKIYIRFLAKRVK